MKPSHPFKYLLAISFMSLILFVEACGVKGPPLPPLAAMPMESPTPRAPVSPPGVVR